MQISDEIARPDSISNPVVDEKKAMVVIVMAPENNKGGGRQRQAIDLEEARGPVGEDGKRQWRRRRRTHVRVLAAAGLELTPNNQPNLADHTTTSTWERAGPGVLDGEHDTELTPPSSRCHFGTESFGRHGLRLAVGL